MADRADHAPMPAISFDVRPETYRHWKLTFDGPVVNLQMDVKEDGGLGDYVLKQNSYDLSVDVELWDAVNRIRFEHPEAKVVVVSTLKAWRPPEAAWQVVDPPENLLALPGAIKDAIEA